MPLYDNIVDALELNTDGGKYTLSLTNQGATLETNESNLTGGYAGIWLKFDLSNFPLGTFDGSDTVHFGRNVFVEMTVTKTGGDSAFLPEVDSIAVHDAIFNPSSPDFDLLQYAGVVDSQYHPPYSGSFVGNGTVTAFGIFEMYGGIDPGPGDHSDQSKSGIWYFLVSDWNYIYHGDLTIVYQFKPAIVRIHAVDHIHPDSTTAIVDGDSVRDDFIDNVNGNLPYEAYPKTLKFDTSDVKSGLYSVMVKGTWNPSNSGYGAVIPFRNGLPISNVMYLPYPPLDYNDYIIKNHETVAEDTDPTTTPTLNYFAPHMLVLQGDNIEFVVASGYDANRFLVEDIFLVQQMAVTKGKIFDILRMEKEPIGFGNQFNFGLEPHEAGWFDSDFCVMPNGDVYVVMMEPITTTAVPPSIDFHYFSMAKYTVVGDNWNIIATGFNGWPYGSRAPQGGICVETDGTDIYMAWWEWTGTYINGTPSTDYQANKTFKWHLRKYSPASGTFTEFGTGQGRYVSTATYSNIIDAFNPPKIVLADDGTIYVFTSESDDTRPNGYIRTVVCYRWNGSSWDDLLMPEPDPAQYQGLTEPDSYVSTHLDAMMGNADGSTQYPCALYGIDANDPSLSSIDDGQPYWDQDKLRFVQYNGSTWETLDVTPRLLDEWWDQQDFEGLGDPYLTFWSRPYNPAMCMAGGKIYSLVTRGGPSSYVWNMYYLNADLSGWTEAQRWHPMVVNGDMIDTQPHMFTGPDDKPYVVYPNGNYQFTIVKLENVGSGGWIIAGDEGIPLYGYQYNAVTPRVKVIGEDVYLCGQIRTYGDYNYLGTFVWKGTRVKNFDYSWSMGLVSFNTTVPLS